MVGVWWRWAFPLPGYLQRLTVQQGVQQFARDVDRARSQARRTNTCRVVSVLRSASYQIQSYTSPNCSGTPTAELLSMPAGTQLTLKSVQGSASFRPPYGTNFTAVPMDLTVASTSHVSVTKDPAHHGRDGLGGHPVKGRAERGLTLVEVMVAVGIFAVLIGAMLPIIPTCSRSTVTPSMFRPWAATPRA